MTEPQRPESRRGGDAVTRRRILALAAYGALGCALPIASRARTRTADARGSVLSFYNLHTGEQLRTVYRENGRYVKSSLSEIDRLLRDHRTGEVRAIDPRLIDLLHSIRTDLGTNEPFHVISGYRSPATNAMLSGRSNGVGRRSLHMRGMAIDVLVPGREVSALQRVARAQGAGGVGYYPRLGLRPRRRRSRSLLVAPSRPRPDREDRQETTLGRLGVATRLLGGSPLPASGRTGQKATW